MRTPKKLMRTVAWPSHASVTALSDHDAGRWRVRRCGHLTTDLVDAIHQEVETPRTDAVSAPRPPAALVATNVRRFHRRRFIWITCRVGPFGPALLNCTIDAMQSLPDALRRRLSGPLPGLEAQLRMAPRPLIPPDPSLESGLRPAAALLLDLPARRCLARAAHGAWLGSASSHRASLFAGWTSRSCRRVGRGRGAAGSLRGDRRRSR